jgi:quercetin dioxygenase-like cupin family protein
MMDDRLQMPDGSVWEMGPSPSDPETEPFTIRMELAPDCVGPPPHIHPPGQRESYEVLTGSFEVLLDGEWQRVGAGQSAEVAPGQVHTFRNRSGETCVVENVHNPGHSFERYMRRLHAFVSGRGLERLSLVGLLGVAQLWSQHRDTIRPGNLPLRAALPILAGVGRIARVRLPP